MLCFSMKWRYIDIEPVLNFIPIKLHRVFLSYNVVTVSSHYLIFYQHMYARQLSNRSIFHAGRYLDDKEICYLRTVRVTANVCHSRNELRNTGHISVIKYRHLELNLVYLLYSRLINIIVIPKLDKWLAKFFTLVHDEHSKWDKPPTFIRVYNVEIVCVRNLHVIRYWCFISKIKTFSYSCCSCLRNWI